MSGAEKLSATKVAKLKEPGRYGDGRGLWLQIGPTGGKSWLFRYMLDGKAREMGLGPLHTIGLAEARLRAGEQRRILLDGRDPLDEKRQRETQLRLVKAQSITFGQCAQNYIDAHRTSWKNLKHVAQWEATFLGDGAITAPINDLPVASIDTALVLKVIEPIWTDTPETASRVRGRIERVLAMATVSGRRLGENPARWGGHLKEMLPSKYKLRRVKHHAAMPYAQIGAFMADLRARDTISARALELTILSASRTSETICARWPEFDLENAVWTVPADRMKAGREHRVPLCERSVNILRKLPREGEFVFPGHRTGKCLSNMAMLELLRGMDANGYTVHGFRSTFRDWCKEQTNYPRELAELALAHVLKDKSEAAYSRGDALEKRRRLMADWAKACAAWALAGTVTPIRATA